jgi:hypothetical protein
MLALLHRPRSQVLEPGEVLKEYEIDFADRCGNGNGYGWFMNTLSSVSTVKPELPPRRAGFPACRFMESPTTLMPCFETMNQCGEIVARASRPEHFIGFACVFANHLTLPHSFRTTSPHEPSLTLASPLKRGNSTVTIYKADRKKNGHVYRDFKLAYYNEIGKRRLRPRFMTLTP